MVNVIHRLGSDTVHVATLSGTVIAAHRRAVDGAGALVRDTGHVVALEHAVLSAFDTAKPCARKTRRPPSRAAVAEAARLLAVALARGAVEAGHRVYFTTAADLVARCHKAALEGRWHTCMRFFAGPKLLVIDELDYLPLPGDGASALFQVINQRYLKSSTNLTTNVGIADWATAFGDATVAAAMLDRLLHRAQCQCLLKTVCVPLVGIDGPSYRLRNH